MSLTRWIPFVALLVAPMCTAAEIGLDTSTRPSHPAVAGPSAPAPGAPGFTGGGPHPSSADPLVLPVASPTITLSLGNGFSGETPMAIGFHPGFNQYYGAMGGNPSYSGFVWGAGGNLLQTRTPINVDVRGVNYNPNTNAIEIVSYGAVFGLDGLLKMGLDGSGLYTGVNATLLGSLPGLASDQTMPAYDPVRNLFYSRSEDANVYVVDHATGSNVGHVPLDLAPAGPTQLLGEGIGYDSDFDVLVTVDLNSYRALVHRMDGSYLGASTLNPFTPTQYRFNMGYAHGQLFVYDASTNAYHGYKILAPAAVHHTITATASTHGSINPHGAVSVQDGGTQAFSITPDAQYQVQDVVVDGGSVGPQNSFTFSNVTTDHTIAASFEPLNGAPVCDGARAVPDHLWPPDHRLVPIAITGLTDPDGDPLTVTVTSVSQDEPIDGTGGDTCPDAVIVSGQVQLRSERLGSGDGRVYTIGFRADDGRGGTCDGSVIVCVPHDQAAESTVPRGRGGHSSNEGGCTGINSGETVNSLACSHGWVVVPLDQGSWTMTAGMPNGGSATVEFNLPEASDVVLVLFDISGRQVADLYRGTQSAGVHTVEWSTSRLHSGMYFYRLQAGRMVLTEPFLNLK